MCTLADRQVKTLFLDILEQIVLPMVKTRKHMGKSLNLIHIAEFKKSCQINRSFRFLRLLNRIRLGFSLIRLRCGIILRLFFLRCLTVCLDSAEKV